MAATCLICLLDSKFRWDPYLLPNYSSKTIRVCNLVWQPEIIWNKDISQRHGIHCITERPLRGVSWNSVWMYTELSIILLHTLQTYLLVLRGFFPGIWNNQYLFFCIPSFLYWYCIIYFHGSTRKNVINIIIKRQIYYPLRESPTRTTRIITLELCDGMRPTKLQTAT